MPTKTTRKFNWFWYFGIASLIMFSGCKNDKPGEDAINRLEKIAPDWNSMTCTEKCHATGSAMDPVEKNGSGTSGKHVKHVSEKGFPCQTCHYEYIAKTTHRNGERDTPIASSRIAFFMENPDSESQGEWINDTGEHTGGCENVYCHGGGIPEWYSTQIVDCKDCHGDGSKIDPTLTGATGNLGKHGPHVTNANFDCEICHYQFDQNPLMGNLKYGRSGTDASDDTTKEADSANWVDFDPSYLADPLNNLTLADATHSAYDPSTPSFTCVVGCHIPNNDLDFNDDPALAADWYRTDHPDWECNICHQSPKIDPNDGVTVRRRPILGSEGDFPGIIATSNIKSHHIIVGKGSDGMPSKEQCKVCHDQSEHTQGTVIVRDADNVGITYRYDKSTASSANVLEDFCLSCHDTDGATVTTLATDNLGALDPFDEQVDLAVLGANVTATINFPYATRIKTSWNKTYGHRNAGGTKQTCLGTGAAGTGCHGNQGVVNAHGSVSQVIAAATFNYGVNYTDDGLIYQESWFQLCAGCHQDAVTSNMSTKNITLQETFGVQYGGNLDWAYHELISTRNNDASPPYVLTDGVVTQFRDHNSTEDYYLNDQPYLTPVKNPYAMNLHWFHIGIPRSNFRGSGNETYFVCVNCHDVHGSNNPVAFTYDELGYEHVTDATGNMYGRIPTANLGRYDDIDPNLYLDPMQNYPTYCAVNCHRLDTLGESKAWFYPFTEEVW